MVRKVTLFVAGMALVLATPAFGDWDPEQASKWVQFPDLSPMGIDVNATGHETAAGYILADDFLCEMTGPITDIHIWGSWLNDYYPWMEDPTAVTFILSIHEDLPVGHPDNPYDYSIPGPVLWYRTFIPGEFTARVWAENIEEGWLDPPDGYFFPADWTCWQYNFFIPEEEAFIQEGTPDQPIVYWLDVQAIPDDPEALFGWKTSLDHWNDDAVWGQGQEPYMGPWQELRYPSGHEMQGQSIDLAFVITTKEEELDFGDAPDPLYPTLLMNDGARHMITGNWPWLGDLTDAPDSEPDGQPDPNATGDDLDIFYPPVNDDEDGVMIPPMTVGVPATIVVEVSGGGAGGFVDAWIDFNGNGTWDAAEQIFSGLMPDGFNNIIVIAPGPFTGQTFARFRISTAGGLAPNGLAQDGEVEDYEVFIEEQEELDFGDAPDSTLIPQYPTLLANNGARHTIVPGVFLGFAVVINPDAEPDGQPDPNALGDDNDGNDDEDGVAFVVPLVPGVPSSVDVTASVDGQLDAWIDFGGDGSWTAGDQIAANLAIAAGTTTVNFVVPATAVVGSTYARFRFTSGGGVLNLPCYGPAPNGEVEDYKVVIETELVPKWSQQPHPESEGFDAASDLWLHADSNGVKWEQLPNPQLPGIHAHDYYQDPDIVQIILADDWVCEGGVVTDFHWWGTEENAGAGIAGFHLSIHFNDPLPCLPMEPPYWWADIPIMAITVTPTGIFNSAGLEIIRYDYDLPEAEWFYQEEGEQYWFNVSALSINPQQPYVWLWQEHARVQPPSHILCPASQWINPLASFWQWITWGDDRYSDMAFRVTSKFLTPREVNKVVADDFISDGRPIEAVTWWGSYLDDLFLPYEPVEPYIIDGWIISFHHESELNPTCPPDALAGEDPTVLGLYFAPRDAVRIVSMGYQDCLGHEVFEYFIKLEDCCLLCSEVDPRDGGIPAEPEAFLEVCGFGYWLDIQAVVGAEWIPPDCDFDYTEHLPSDITSNGHFWGWHTSYEEKLEDACTGGIVDFALDPTNCWDYGDWDKQQWECPWVAPPVNMAFELLTTEPDPPPWPKFSAIQSMGDHSGIVGDLGLDVDWSDTADNHEPRKFTVAGLNDLYISVTFTETMAAGAYALDDGTNPEVTPAIIGAVATADGSNVVKITFPGAAPSDDTCYVFDLAGMTTVAGATFGDCGEDTDFCLCYLESDVDDSGVVAGLDTAAIAAQWGNTAGAPPVPDTIRADVDRSGIVAGLDMATVAANWGDAASCP